MPRGDQTGPFGQGPLTGRGAGYCAGNRAPGFAGGGRGRRNCFWLTGLAGWMRRGGRFFADAATLPADDQQELQQLRQQLARTQARLDALEKKGSNS